MTTCVLKYTCHFLEEVCCFQIHTYKEEQATMKTALAGSYETLVLTLYQKIILRH